jgi:chemotaxis protein methyltransferase WspC
MQLARQAADLGKLDQADAICARVLAQDPANAEVHYLSGVIRQSQGAMAAARQWFEKTLYLDPTHYQALVHLMLLAEQSGDLVQASNYRRRAERSAPVEVVR